MDEKISDPHDPRTISKSRSRKLVHEYLMEYRFFEEADHSKKVQLAKMQMSCTWKLSSKEINDPGWCFWQQLLEVTGQYI